MRQLTRDVSKLKEDDVINVLLYAIYKLTNDPEYSAISELAYVLDKDSLYKLCATFGGAIIKIPPLSLFKNITKALLIIELMQKGETFEEAYADADVNVRDKSEVVKIVDQLVEIVNSYDMSE